ncbi:scarecrow-like protein 33 isoform X1 [Rhododendron vialii]|uniref:scarecrow-like protein 33 isoform X1 n=2 Tax=Rhododendron vialii TaxID=182163 RepID=UPI00265D6443|nr:scarecrow-like protein 33 isoform X1 [Rhododendron vialii]
MVNFIWHRAFEQHMVMDQRFTDFSNSMNGFKFDDDAFSPAFDDSEYLSSFVASISSGSSEADSPDDIGLSDNVLKFISTILMEEKMEQKPSMFHDPLALLATEKSLYDVIGEKFPLSPSQPPLYLNQNVESPDEHFFGSSSEHSSNSNTSWSFSVDSQGVVNPGEYEQSIQGYSVAYPFGTSFGSTESFSHTGSGPMNSSLSCHLVPNIFSDSQSILQFNKGVEESSKFLPDNSQLLIDLECYDLPPESNGGASEVVVNVEDTGETSPNRSRGKRNPHRLDSNNVEEERNSKLSAVHVDESEISDVFDKVLLFDPKVEGICCHGDEKRLSEATKATQLNGQPHGSKGGKIRGKKQGNKTEVVDLRALLTNCAQSVAANDRRTANEQLKQIRQHSSPTGDGYQRLANVFANGLEARLAGTGSQIYAALASKRISAAEKLKAYQLYLSSCPFQKMSLFFANKTIVDLAMNSGKKKLHIIDFGIVYGFQWPMVIQHLSTIIPGIELRITGIELPRPGFRPAELVEETGRRLAKYCERFNVPFQYHAIAQKWETIKIEDLNIHDDEVLSVNCIFRFKNLLDENHETVTEDSPRDAVLKLIRKMNPDIFIQSVINGSYNSPFFVTRFREALYHYSSLFDMLDANIPRDNQERMDFEQEFLGREIMNVIACEGAERVEKPETYKQWQARTMRAGLKILPLLSQELLRKFRCNVKARYHKDFVIDEDGQWMLQGWKGRIICASSCWVPA